MTSVLELEEADVDLENLHCNVIIGRIPIEANVNTGEIQLLVNPVAYIWYQILLHSILEIPLASIGKLPFIDKLPLET